VKTKGPSLYKKQQHYHSKVNKTMKRNNNSITQKSTKQWTEIKLEHHEPPTIYKTGIGKWQSIIYMYISIREIIVSDGLVFSSL
jgi:hypothetical protein